MWTDQAKENVRAILSRMLDRQSDQVSERFSAQVVKMTQQLAQHPYSGEVHPTLSSVRRLRVESNYRLIYTVVESQREVVILNCYHDSQKQ